MQCDRCNEEFETEAEMDKHRAEKHPQPQSGEGEELEEPAYPQAVNE